MTDFKLETARLIVRPQTADDIAAIVPLLNDYAVSKNLSRVPYPYTEEDALRFFHTGREDRASGTAHPFLLTDRLSGAPIGGCGLRRKDNGMLELGYWLGRPYWGNGFATEGAGRVARYAFEELDEPVLWASYHHDNRASGHVLAKLGAVPAGAEHHHCVARGHAVYCHVVMIDRENFGLKIGRAR